ncbi:MAG: hypothetical protein OXC95_08980 [Dehalococcoidia bacterium]|nr:hypothetical protein [Dehalococcoidia bacterium]
MNRQYLDFGVLAMETAAPENVRGIGTWTTTLRRQLQRIKRRFSSVIRLAQVTMLVTVLERRLVR